LTGRIQPSDASGAATRAWSSYWKHPGNDASRREEVNQTHPGFSTHPGSDASPLTGRIQFQTHLGSDAPLFNWTHPVSGRIRAATHRCLTGSIQFRTHPGSDASLGEEITGRIQFRTHPGSDASLFNWMHPVPDASGQRRIAV
jgi:hypothetical protein